MVVRTFCFKGGKGTQVIGVGLRPSVIYHANAMYRLKAVAQNVPGRAGKADRVEVVVMGPEADIALLHDHVRSNDIRQVKKGRRPDVSELVEYDGAEPDWNYCLSATNSEQIYKGFSEIRGMRADMAEMRGDMAEMRSDMREIKNDIAEMRGDMAEIKNGIDAMTTAMTGMATAMTGMATTMGDIKSAISDMSADIEELKNTLMALVNKVNQ